MKKIHRIMFVQLFFILSPVLLYFAILRFTNGIDEFYRLVTLFTASSPLLSGVAKTSYDEGYYIVFFILVSTIIYFKVSKSNAEKDINTGNDYLDCNYFTFWICAKILKFRKCSLERVPIPMQFMLVINDTFVETLVQEPNSIDLQPETYYVEMPKISETNVVNIVLEDTFEINEANLPNSVTKYPIIKISRGECNKKLRLSSRKFLDCIRLRICELPSNVSELNIFATTNAFHSKLVAEQNFKVAGRSSIHIIRVFYTKKDYTIFDDKFIQINLSKD